MLERILTTKAAKRAVPRYLEMAGELREEILAGRHAKDAPFPTESELCKRYSVSRFTVREALRRLQGEGLIARRRGSGTTVQPAAARGGTLHQPLSNIGEILQYSRGSQVNYTRTESCALPQSVAEKLAEPCTGNWSSFRGVRRHAGAALPIGVTDAYFHERLSHAVDQFDLSADTLFSQVEKLAGVVIGQVTQDIQAVTVDAELAAILEIREGDPVLSILRCYFDLRGDLFEISVSRHPGDRFAYAMHMDVDC